MSVEEAESSKSLSVYWQADGLIPAHISTLKNANVPQHNQMQTTPSPMSFKKITDMKQSAVETIKIWRISFFDTT